MNGRILFTVLTAAALTGSASAQNQQRARMIGGGSSDAGRCFAEVVVDGAAELQVYGDTASLRNLSGGEPQWRRFECTSPMPQNADVRLNINGRGRAQLISSPRNGGPAVVRIEDSKGGAEVYQMEFQWTGGTPYYGGSQAPGWGGNQARGRVSPDQAVENCRQAVREEARNRFGTDDVNFRQINIDDQQGNRDLVVGTLGIRRGGWNVEAHPFSCTMNLNNGRVRQARISGSGGGGGNDRYGYAGRDVQAREMDTCRTAVIGRVGSDRVEFGPMNIEDRSGDDLVRGTARARGRNYDFTCSVSPFSGTVRNVDVRVR
jgi:hypothetical protein